MSEIKNTKKTIKKVWSIGTVIVSFLQIFKSKCPECGSKDNNIECYSGNPYAKNERYETGRQCNNCINFWYS